MQTANVWTNLYNEFQNLSPKLFYDELIVINQVINFFVTKVYDDEMVTFGHP